MKIVPGSAFQQCLSLLNVTSVLSATLLSLASPVSGQDAPKVDAGQLDQIVARIALYPDPLLAQVLAASSFSDRFRTRGNGQISTRI